MVVYIPLVNKGPKRYTKWVSWSIQAVGSSRVLHDLLHLQLRYQILVFSALLQGNSIIPVTLSPFEVIVLFAVD